MPQEMIPQGGIDWTELLRGEAGLIELHRLLLPVAVPQDHAVASTSESAYRRFVCSGLEDSKRVVKAAGVWRQIKLQR